MFLLPGRIEALVGAELEEHFGAYMAALGTIVQDAGGVIRIPRHNMIRYLEDERVQRLSARFDGPDLVIQCDVVQPH